MNGLLFIFIFLEFGFNLTTMPLFIFADILLVVSVIDLDHQIIPDVISLPGTLVGFVCSFAQPWLTWTDSLFGILLGGGSLYVVAVCYELLTKKEGMGGGDIKLLAMIGAFLGWKAIFPVIFFSSLVGTMVGLPLMLFRNQNRRYAIPFGPFLSLAALIYLFYGPQLISWYLDFAKLS
jgi:leader peptidase (prepilin peptidase)/N-methyltransferase